VLKVPVTVNPKTALAVADRLLADPNIRNARSVVANTIAVAKIPNLENNPHLNEIQAGAAIIDAAQLIRDKTGAQPGQPAIPVQNAVQQNAVDTALQTTAYTLTDADVHALDAFSPPTHKTAWKRFFDWVASWSH
jgi:hypothetical protein